MLGRRLQRSIGARIHFDPSLAAKLVPLARQNGAIVLERSNAEQSLPPDELWEGYGPTGSEYLESGRRDVDSMLRILEAHSGAPERVLDFGCAAGRMVRHLPWGPANEYWGVDINARHIRWCQEHMPGINFAVTTTAPHLPFDDGYFDLVYAASVFTHISELADSTLLEIRRVLRPGGLAYLTVHDLESYELLFTRYGDEPLFADLLALARPFESQHALRGRKVDAFSFGADPLSQVFYDADYLVAKWGRWMDVVAYVPQAHDHQSAIVLRNRKPVAQSHERGISRNRAP